MENSLDILYSCLAVQDESLDKAGYEIVRNSILKNLLTYGAMSAEQLGGLVEKHLTRKYRGSLGQYYDAVRRDLEARGEIRRIFGPRLSLIDLGL